MIKTIFEKIAMMLFILAVVVMELLPVIVCLWLLILFTSMVNK